MTKLYMKEIKRCMVCPNYEHRDFEFAGGAFQDWCTLSKKEIFPMSNQIPAWCELPDNRSVDIIDRGKIMDHIPLR